MSAYAEASRRVKPRSRKPEPAAEPVEDRDPLLCQAYGCPVPAGISPSITGGGRWYCRFHFGREPIEFDAITAELQSGETLRDEARRRALKSPTVRAMLSKVASKAAEADLVERQPGEDDE